MISNHLMQINNEKVQAEQREIQNAVWGGKEYSKCEEVKSSVQGGKNVYREIDDKWSKGSGKLRLRPQQAKLPLIQSNLKSLSSEEKHPKPKVDTKVTEQGGQISAPASKRALQLPSYASDLRVKGTRKGLQKLPPLLKKAVDAKLYHGCPCTEGQRGLVCDTVKRESGFQWRLEDVEDARAINYLPRRAGSQVWNQPKRE